MGNTLDRSTKDAFREVGLQYTQQRQLVWDILRSRRSHLDAYDVYEEVRRSGGAMSLSTVYRILQAFRDRGLIAENHLGEDHHHYEAVSNAAETDHHHAVCSRCGAVVEFTLSSESLLASEAALAGFEVESIELSVSGVCQECRKRGGM
jgi:Fe2+ or Zn2+ uptake regulation protein